MQTRSSDENSVRLSVKRVHCDKMEERSAQIFIPYGSFSLVFWEEEWLVGGRRATPSTWNLGSTGRRWSHIVYFEPILARSASVVTPSEKSSINTNRKSTMRFPMSRTCERSGKQSEWAENRVERSGAWSKHGRKRWSGNRPLTARSGLTFHSTHFMT